MCRSSTALAKSHTMAAALTCLRAFFIILSILYVIVGLAGSIATGVFIWIFRSTGEVKDLFTLAEQPNTFNQVTIALIVICVSFAIMMVAGFVGCCAMGRRNHNQCCQDLLAIFALIITIMFTAAVILLAVYRTKLENGVRQSFEINMKAYGSVSGPVLGDVADSAVRTYVDGVQNGQKCCGSSSYLSWRELRTTWSIDNPNEIAPTSCCFRPSEAGCNTNPTTIYQRGCSDVLGNISSNVYTVIYIVGAVIALVSLIEMLTACYMARTSAKGEGKRCCCC